MHVPSAASQTIELLSFDEALERSGHSGGYDPGRWIYVPDFYTEYRYILGTRGKRPLICVGVNPSTAEPDRLDNTLKSVGRIAGGNGFDSFIMFNVYAQRATRPDDMDRALNERLHRENLRAFEYILSQSAAEGSTPCVWAAWGAVIEKRAYLPGCVRDMLTLGERFGARWVCAGSCSVKGHPHHPLYLRKDEKIRDFDVEAYLDRL
ncbi:MAG: DUF1643 domain-containing protein [Oscillospiraceae bacterium]|nr:DUF1643 domain-containing protein [Oscillospiraceae bacterium]